jgi:hypothetical protein
VHLDRGLRALLTVAVAVALTGCGTTLETTPKPVAPDATTGALESARPTPSTVPGHELYGFLPYWEMDGDGIVDHVAATPLTTLALFSVTHTSSGSIATGQHGYQLITGDIGRRLITTAHEHGIRVELVYTSFGAARNRKLLESDALQAKVTTALVALVADLGVDGINVDVEALDATLVPAYGAFVGRLRTALRAVDPSHTLSVATGAHALGAGMAVAAASAGADRIFIMAYDYRTGRSDPGASAPLDRSDGGTSSIRTSLDLYLALGVPPERLLLGLPLYGVSWPVAGPVVGAPATGRGDAWFPEAHLDLLANPEVVPLTDDIEKVEVYLVASDGTIGPPSPDPSATLAPTRTWQAIYVDSPATLAPKLALANDNGLAGAGFWAIGYERGLPAYTDLMTRFRGGTALQ